MTCNSFSALTLLDDRKHMTYCNKLVSDELCDADLCPLQSFQLLHETQQPQSECAILRVAMNRWTCRKKVNLHDKNHLKPLSHVSRTLTCELLQTDIPGHSIYRASIMSCCKNCHHTSNSHLITCHSSESGNTIASVHPSVCVSTCIHSSFWTIWPLTLIFCM